MAESKNGRHAHIVGWGKYVPSKVLTNADLAQIVDTSDEWIVTRTGIHERRIAGPKDTSASMGLIAAKEALEHAGVRPHEVDLIIVATATPEYAFPATACLIQDALGAVNAGAFDLSAGCTGFMYALAVGAQAIQSGAHKIVLVIGSETLSRIMDWKDRSTCVLFGDGAGAIVLSAGNSSGGILSTICRSDGSGGDLLIVPGGGSRCPTSHQTVDQGLHFIKMNGREVFRFAARVMDKSAREVAARDGRHRRTRADRMDGRLGQFPSVHLYDIDDLQAVADAGMREREKEVEKVEALVEEEVSRFVEWYRSLDVIPTIAALREHAERVRRVELDKTLGRLPELSPEERARVEAMTSAIVKKILHQPIARLKSEGGNDEQYVTALRDLFALGEHSPEP